MKSYTVVLLRPGYMCTEDCRYGLNIYVAWIKKAESAKQAIKLAQQEVYKADKANYASEGCEVKPKLPDDYELCVLFNGTHRPELFGWQSY